MWAAPTSTKRLSGVILSTSESAIFLVSILAGSPHHHHHPPTLHTPICAPLVKEAAILAERPGRNSAGVATDRTDRQDNKSLNMISAMFGKYACQRGSRDRQEQCDGGWGLKKARSALASILSFGGAE